MDTKFEWIDNNLIATISGDINYDSLLTASETVYGDSRLDNMDYFIINFFNIYSFSLLEREINIIAALDKSASRWNPNLKLACVTTDTIINKTFLKYLDSIKEVSWRFEIFSNLDEAKKWCEEE